MAANVIPLSWIDISVKNTIQSDIISNNNTKFGLHIVIFLLYIIYLTK
jgi:hypothetical protein